MASLRTILPALPLRPYVSAYLFLSADKEEKILSAPPQLSSGLAFLWGGGVISHSGKQEVLPSRYIVPVTAEAYDAYGTSPSTLVGVKFYPGKFYEFFGWPQYLFYDNTIQLDDTDLSKRAALLHEALDEVQRPDLQAKLLDYFLLLYFPRQPKSSPLIDSILNSLYHAPDIQSLRQVQPEVQVSSRHLRRLFRTYTGLNSRTFIRILRFYRAYFMLHTTPYSSLTELALRAGYFDQPHFIHDFKHFLNISPRAYLKRTLHPETKLAWEGLRKEGIKTGSPDTDTLY